MKKYFVISFLLLLISSYSSANPSISNVSGTMEDGQTITITGSSFGSGPTIVLFDDFSSGTPGQTHSSNATVGTWSGTDCIIFEDSELSQEKGARCIDSPGQLTSVVTFSTTQEVFVSSIVYVPDGYYFPSAESEETYPDQSSMKHFWIMYSSDGYSNSADPDYFIGAWTGSSWYRVGSNDGGGPSTFDTGGTDFQWDIPNRWSIWIKGNGTSVSGTDGMFQNVNSNSMVQTDYANFKAWFIGSHTTYGFDRVNVVGYVRSGANYSYGQNWVIDDMYVAAGSNAAARVEIGDENTYSNCRQLAIITPTSWSTTSITATVRQGLFDTSDTVYLYVIDSSNDVSTSYGPLTVGASAAETSAKGITIQ